MDDQRSHKYLVKIDEYAELDRLGDRALELFESSGKELLRYTVDLKAKHVIQTTSPFRDAELASSIALIEDPDLYFKSPLLVALDPKGQAKQPLLRFEQEFWSSRQKSDLIGSLINAVSSFAKPRSLGDDVRQVADEMFMNAIFNAPFEPTVAKADRTKEVSYPDQKKGRLSLGVLNDRIALCCEDPFGSLEARKFLGRILYCFDHGVRRAMNFRDGGAGIGGLLIFEACQSLFIGVKPQVATTIVATFAIGKGSRARRGLPKNLHIMA